MQRERSKIEIVKKPVKVKWKGHQSRAHQINCHKITFGFIARFVYVVFLLITVRWIVVWFNCPLRNNPLDLFQLSICTLTLSSSSLTSEMRIKIRFPPSPCCCCCLCKLIKWENEKVYIARWEKIILEGWRNSHSWLKSSTSLVLLFGRLNHQVDIETMGLKLRGKLEAVKVTDFGILNALKPYKCRN